MAQQTFLISPDPAQGLAPSDMTDKGAFTTDDTTELNHTHFSSDGDKISTGTWECAPCREEFPDGYPVHEMMTVVSGALTLTHADGRKESFGPGDTFFIAKGTPLTWEITETLRKIYMIAE